MPGLHLGTLREVGYAKENDRDLRTQARAVADAPRHRHCARRIDAWTNKQQVGRVKAGLHDRLLLVSGGLYPVTAGSQQLLGPTARFFHILDHEND